ncbi:AMP-binding enzyme [Siccirubricoccus sp. G192]|uniref:AMP-binding enzyme n=1 Tax=Siccirubricoccus sp. G192 TaxID=2849651 RepID=UPI0028124D72|nr:AMP-binding protein [Siccirubricoccus sp. G192]
MLDNAEQPIPHDGLAFGELEVRGPWIASAYFNRKGDPAFTGDGWFRTGDVVTVDELGCIEIVDRAKDVIKSGGEWISSITLENLVMGHPAVQEAAVIATPHAKWDERPLLLVVPKPGTTPTAEDILGYYEGKVAKWWIPDAVGIRGEPAAYRHRQAVEGGAEGPLPGPAGGVAGETLAWPLPGRDVPLGFPGLGVERE